MDIFIIVFYINLFFVYMALLAILYVLFNCLTEDNSIKTKKKMLKPPNF